MCWLRWTVLLAFVAQSFGSGEPAVRVRVTQKGLDYGIDSAMEYAKAQLENYSLPDTKGKLFGFDYGFTNMKIFNINITYKSLRPVPKKGLYSILRNVDFDIIGNWGFKMGSWFSNYGTFSVAVQGMSVAILLHLGVNGDRLVVSNITCASKLENININLIGGQTSFLFSMVQGTMNGVMKSRIPKLVCEEGKKAMKKDLNEQFAKFPVRQHLKRSVTLDYSVVKKPEYKYDAVDLFLKGEFQPSDRIVWIHQPAPLPRDYSRDRMMYVTIMDHMINSASHAYYVQGAMKVQVTVKQTIVQQLPKNGIFGRVMSRLNTGLGMFQQSACSNCDIRISLSATSPPQIRTSHSGIHLTVHAIAKINVLLGNKLGKDLLDLETNVTATAIPKLNGTNLSTNITNLKINTRVLKSSMLSTLSGKVLEMEKIVKKEVEKLLENGISAMEIPLPLSEKFQLIKPKISYGQGYMTLETDVLII